MGQLYRDRIIGQVLIVGDRDSDVCIIKDAGVPNSGAEGTGVGLTGPGSLFIDTANGALYENRGTKESPDWDQIGKVDPSELFLEVQNETGGDLDPGTLVYISGWDETADLPLVALAEADEEGRQAQFVVRETIDDGDSGRVWKTLVLEGSAEDPVDTDAGVIGDPVYLSTTGGEWALDAPEGADEVVQIVGFVVASDVQDGVIKFDLFAAQLTKIGTNELQDDAVTTAKIEDNAVTAGKLAPDLELEPIPLFPTDVGLIADPDFALHKIVALMGDGELELAVVNDTLALGSAYDVPGEAEDPIPVKTGIATIIAEIALSVRDPIKVGTEGRAMLWRSTTDELDDDIPGTADLFNNQPAGTPVRVAQAGNIEADRGGTVTVIGLDGANNVITEDIDLDPTDSSTPVAGTTDFTSVIAAVFEQVCGGDIEVQRTDPDNAVICTITDGQDNVGAPAMPGAPEEAYNSIIGARADGQDETFVTIFGTDPDGDPLFSRFQLDNADPNSGGVTAVPFRTVVRVITGELLNTTQISANLMPDPASWLLGRVVEEALAPDDEVRAFITSAWLY